jgi:hypothetical protein
VIAVTAKWQEPNVVVPLAVPVDVLIENSGLVASAVLSLKVSVVGVVVPNSVTPEEKVKGVPETPLVVVGDAARVVSDAATITGSLPPPPPPHAERTSAVSATAKPEMIFIASSPKTIDERVRG